MEPGPTDTAAPAADRGRSPIRSLLIAIAPIALAALLCLAAYCAFCGWSYWMWTRDESRGLGNINEVQAIAAFREHRRVCDRLRELAIGDGIDWPLPAHERLRHGVRHDVGPERAGTYRRLLDELGAYGVRAGWSTRQDGFACEIELASHGNFFHREHASFVHVPGGVAPPDRPPRGDDPDFERFTPLGDGWFLRYYTH
jgi:hypothetical protein